MLLFGRATYEHMAQHWPTPAAIEADPVTAARMNGIRKVVFSPSNFRNGSSTGTDPVARIDELKRESGAGDLALFGSSTFTADLLQAGVVDEVRVMVNPILLGGGVPLYTGLTERVPLRLARTITFRNGNALLCYTPGAQPPAP